MKVANQNNYFGFTIVELLVVIVVIAIFAAITIVSYTGISQKATAVSLQSDLTSASKQLKLYYVDHGAYPTSPLAVSGNSYCPSDDIKYCIKTSPGNTFIYTPAVGTSPQTFLLKNSKSSVAYIITESTSPELAPVFTTTTTGGGIKNTDGAYTVIAYTSSGTLVTSNGTIDAEVLVVGGGGGGSHGGGGAGGYLTGTITLTGTMAVTVGNGGAGGNYMYPHSLGSTGGDSIFGSYTAKGGGGGGGAWSPGLAGASGGGNAGEVNPSQSVGGAATPAGQGNPGGGNVYGYPHVSGGGGAATAGASGAGSQNGNGGAGYNNSISGTSVGYAGGGGGGVYGGTPGSATHGGGAGRSGSAGNGNAGTPNTGGGGGGAWYQGTGGMGGSGVVIIRYLTP